MKPEASISEAAATLDVKVPGWHIRVDLDALDQSSCRLCVLGQLFRTYGGGLANVYGDYELLSADYEHAYTTPKGKEAAKTEAWRKEILKRR